MDDEKVEMYFKKYKNTNIMKRIILLISFFLCSFIISVISKLNMNDYLFFLMCIVVVIFVLLVFLFVSTFMDKKWYSLIRMVLEEKCDSELYVHIYEKIYSSEKRNVFIVYEYIDGLILNGNYTKAKELLNENCKNHKSIHFKKRFYNLYRFENANQMNLIREELINYYKKQYEKKRLDSFRNLITIYEIHTLIDCKNYLEALKLIEDYHSSLLLEYVNISFNKGLCLYCIGELDKAKKCFETVTKNGNTLEIVKKSKQYIQLIDIGE